MFLVHKYFQMNTFTKSQAELFRVFRDTRANISVIGKPGEEWMILFLF